MIISLIVNAVKVVLQTVLGILPDLPDMPTSITSAGTWLSDQIVAVISVLSMVLTPTLLTAVMTVVALLYGFEYIYHLVMWILRKIPMLSIK